MIISLPTGGTLAVPSWIVCIVFIVEMLLIAQAGLWVFNRFSGNIRQQQNNEVAGIVFGAIALIYSLMLAFIIVAIWDDYNDLDKTIQEETDKLNSILAHTSTLPDNIREIVGKSVYDYCDQVINQEWKMDETRAEHPSAIPALRQELLNVQPENFVQQRIFEAVDDDLSSVSDLHRERLSHTHSQMPQLIWQILKAGTVILIVFTYFFHVSSDKLKRVYLSFIVVSVSMCMFLVYTLDHPFNGQDGVSNQSYRNVQQEIKSYMPVLAKGKNHQPSLYNTAN